MLDRNNLRKMLEEYVKEGMRVDLLPEEICFYLVEAMNDMLKDENRVISCIVNARQKLADKKDDDEVIKRVEKQNSKEISKETYYKLAEDVIRKLSTVRVPKHDILLTGINIMYVIHEKKYKTVEEFFEVLRNDFEMNYKQFESRILGNDKSCQYSGLKSFTNIFVDVSFMDWRIFTKKERLSHLEKAESRLFLEIVAEYRRRETEGL